MAGPGQCGFRLPPEPAIASTGPAPPSIHTTQAGVHEKGLDASVAKDWLYAFAIQSLDYALLAVDADQRILWANPGAGWILAATQSEIVGSQIAQFFTPEDRAVGIPEHEQRSALRQGSSDDDRWMLRADRSRFWASGKTIALSRNDGVPMGFFKIFRDQTEVKMRTDALAQDDAARLPADSEPAAAPAERVSLQAAVHGAIALAGAEVGVGHRRIEVLFPAGAPIETRGDRGQLQQAFAALIGHALRATADDGHVWINGTTEGELASVRVEDNGRGMAGARLAEIYDLFTSPVLEPLEPGTAGELATARGIVDAHGGTMQARSAGAGKGSEFVVTLPLARD